MSQLPIHITVPASHNRASEQCLERHSPEPSDSGIGNDETLDPKKCVVLVPVGNQIEPICEDSLRRLEMRGYTVHRVRGYSAIDQARNQMGTDALEQGFEETMWIDSDVGFRVEDVERLRSHNLPIACAIYPKKNMRELAVSTVPGTTTIVFGEGGGLHEVLYAAAGFLHVRKPVYAAMVEKLGLPTCNLRFGKPHIPFFMPMIVNDSGGSWYLAEDYAFCERARRCGFRIFADTTIRLLHFGTFGFSWEDAGLEKPRYARFDFHLG